MTGLFPSVRQTRAGQSVAHLGISGVRRTIHTFLDYHVENLLPCPRGRAAGKLVAPFFLHTLVRLTVIA